MQFEHFDSCDLSVLDETSKNKPQPIISDKEELKDMESKPETSGVSSGPRVYECPLCLEEKTHVSSLKCGHLFCTE